MSVVDGSVGNLKRPGAREKHILSWRGFTWSQYAFAS